MRGCSLNFTVFMKLCWNSFPSTCAASISMWESPRHIRFVTIYWRFFGIMLIIISLSLSRAFYLSVEELSHVLESLDLPLVALVRELSFVERPRRHYFYLEVSETLMHCWHKHSTAVLHPTWCCVCNNESLSVLVRLFQTCWLEKEKGRLASCRDGGRVLVLSYDYAYSWGVKVVEMFLLFGSDVLKTLRIEVARAKEGVVPVEDNHCSLVGMDGRCVRKEYFFISISLSDYLSSAS